MSIHEKKEQDSSSKTVTYSDDKGGSIIIRKTNPRGFAEGSTSITLEDDMDSIKLGSKYSPATVLPYNGKEFPVIRPNDRLFAKGSKRIACETSGIIYDYSNKPSVGVVQDVSDSITREAIQKFAQVHPELARKVTELKIPIAEYRGELATMDVLLAAPAHFQACPLDVKGNPKVNEKGQRIIVQRVGG